MIKRESVNSKWELSWNLFTLNKYGGPPIIEGLTFNSSAKMFIILIFFDNLLSQIYGCNPIMP